MTSALTSLLVKDALDMTVTWAMLTSLLPKDETLTSSSGHLFHHSTKPKTCCKAIEMILKTRVPPPHGCRMFYKAGETLAAKNIVVTKATSQFLMKYSTSTGV
jgi:hypothetical protein